MIEFCQIVLNGISFQVDLSHPITLAIPMQAGDQNPNCYYTDPVKIETIRAEGFVGDIQEGGPCNHRQITFAPHGNGTHTECYGHISEDRVATIANCLTQFHFIAKVITVTPLANSSGDLIIDESQVLPLLKNSSIKALIIRTLPNDASKSTRQYSGSNPPYMSTALAQGLAECGIQHLLVDLPSVDREEDDGALSAHKAFWGYPATIRKDCTITELIYIAPDVPDGLYLLNLQVMNLHSDASPSNPLLFAVI